MFVLNVIIFFLGIVLKYLYLVEKLCLEILFFFVYFRGVKNISFILKSSMLVLKIDLGGVNVLVNIDYI